MVSARPPQWLRDVAKGADDGELAALAQHLGVGDMEARRSAVLMLFGPGQESSAGPGGPARSDHGASGVDILLIERAHTLRSHPGQPAFPGGAVDPDDSGPVDAALREAVEETGLEPGGVDVLTTFPDLWLPPSGFVVTPVLAWWREPSPVRVMDPAECASVHRVPVSELVDPAHRLRVRHRSGYVGAAFKVRGLLVWGFTAGILATLLDSAGLTMPWDESRVEEMREVAEAGRRGR